MHTSRYNVFDAQGQLSIAPGDPIDQAEAERQGLIRPAPVEAAAVRLTTPTAAAATALAELGVETQALVQPSATAERKRGR